MSLTYVKITNVKALTKKIDYLLRLADDAYRLKPEIIDRIEGKKYFFGLIKSADSYQVKGWVNKALPKAFEIYRFIDRFLMRNENNLIELKKLLLSGSTDYYLESKLVVVYRALLEFEV